MKKNQKNLKITLDNGRYIVYTKSMTNNNNNNTNRKEKQMLHLDEIVAIKMQDGLTIEKEQITDIGRVLKEMGKSFTERSYLLSVDEDFIPDVLGYYNHKNN